jgi:hypothetical protein
MVWLPPSRVAEVKGCKDIAAPGAALFTSDFPRLPVSTLHHPARFMSSVLPMLQWMRITGKSQNL